MIRRTAYISAAVILACVAALAIDYAVARSRQPAHDKLVEELQAKVREDASYAPQLEAVQKRMAAAILARKRRVDWFAVVLIAASAVYIASAKRLVKPQPPPQPPERLIHIAARAPAKPLARPPAQALDLAEVDAIVGREGRTAESVIPILQAIQAHYRYLPDDALRRVAELTGIPPALLAGTSSFYSRFRRSPVGEHIVRVCHGTACHVAGARQISDELRRALEIPDGADTDPSRTFTLEEVACLGCCSLAPVLMVDERTAGKLTPATACDALEAAHPREPA
jgi:NADH:ubiquinone oxidoreductase subunit E